MRPSSGAPIRYLRSVGLRDRFTPWLSRHPRAYRGLRRSVTLGRYALRRPHEPDFEYFAHTDRSGLLVDVGANAGQSALSFRLYQPRSPVLSFEPNAENEPELRLVKRILRDFDYRLLAAGERDEELTLYVPTINRVTLTGEASLEKPDGSGWLVRQRREAHPDAELGVAERRVSVRRLDGLDLKPAFVKIDVEGGELSVLRGCKRTLAEHRPVVMMEYPGELEAVRDYMGGLGYAMKRWSAEAKRLEDYDGSEWTLNVFFEPAGAGRNPSERARSVRA
jgi:FkbM family methyltransferase